MPRTNPERERQRRDVWLTDEDMQRVLRLADEMVKKGLNPNNHLGKLSVSKVIRWALSQHPLIIGGGIDT